MTKDENYRYLEINFNPSFHEVVVQASPAVLRHMAEVFLRLADKQTMGSHAHFDQALGYLEGENSLIVRLFASDENNNS